MLRLGRVSFHGRAERKHDEEVPGTNGAVGGRGAKLGSGEKLTLMLREIASASQGLQSRTFNRREQA